MNFSKLKTKLIESAKYDVYHDTYSAAVSAAIDYAAKQGYEVDMDAVFDKVSSGPRKPSEGKTNTFNIELLKKGVPVKNKRLNFQVYGMGRKYELNAYVA